MPILEVMSDGTPVVATPAGWQLDVIAQERDGLLVHVGDQAAVRLAMVRAVLNFAASAGSAARAKAGSLDVAFYSERYCGFAVMSSCSNP